MSFNCTWNRNMIINRHSIYTLKHKHNDYKHKMKNILLINKMCVSFSLFCMRFGFRSKSPPISSRFVSSSAKFPGEGYTSLTSVAASNPSIAKNIQTYRQSRCVSFEIYTHRRAHQ